MAICPSCGSRVPSPLKTLSVYGDLDSKRLFKQSMVGIYQCSKCQTKFPFTTSTEKLEMVRHDDLVRLREEYEVTRKKKDDLASKGLHLEQENTRLKENLELVKLESTANALGKEVSALRRGKEILQDQISTLTDEVQS